MSLFADTIAPVRRSQPEELFLIRMVAKPLPESGEATDIGGAYVNCWVDAVDLRTAEQAALERVRAEHWQPTKFEGWELVCRECYTDESSYDEDERRESLERVKEAYEHGIALTFHCWPGDTTDAQDDHT